MSLRYGSCSGSCRCPGTRQWTQRLSTRCFQPASARGRVADATAFSEVWLPRAICSASPEGNCLTVRARPVDAVGPWTDGEEGLDVLEAGKCPVRLAVFVGKEEGKGHARWPASTPVTTCTGFRPAPRSLDTSGFLVLGEYTDHYNSHRPHRSLQQESPAGRVHPPVEVTGMHVLRRDRLGGLIHEYTQVA